MSKIIGRISDASLKIETTVSNNALVVETTILGAGLQGPPGPMGTTNYNLLENRPSIQSIELIGNRTFEDLGLSPMTPNEIENLI
jgi:hypothetical protein